MSAFEPPEERIAPEGKYQILGIDRYKPPGSDDAHWVVGDYDSQAEALRVAREKTREAGGFAMDASGQTASEGSERARAVATVYYVYDDEGRYLGGDIYEEE